MSKQSKYVAVVTLTKPLERKPINCAHLLKITNLCSFFSGLAFIMRSIPKQAKQPLVLFPSILIRKTFRHIVSPISIVRKNIQDLKNINKSIRINLSRLSVGTRLSSVSIATYSIQFTWFLYQTNNIHLRKEKFGHYQEYWITNGKHPKIEITVTNEVFYNRAWMSRKSHQHLVDKTS